jgi:4-hydroxy-tetrahydrodipicolinate synthase
MFSGSLVAIVTPMHPDGGIDWPAWSSLLEWHVAAGTSGIVVGGTTGESATLSDAELIELLTRGRTQVRGRVALIVGAGTSSTATTVERVRSLSAASADGLLIVTPAYNKPTQEGLYRHFEAAAAAATVPVILYNVPARTAVDMLPTTVARLAQLPRIVAVKEAVNSVERVRELVASTPADFAVLSGDDATAAAAMRHGARGVISVTANVLAAPMAQMVAAALRGEHALAEQLDAPLQPLHRVLFIEANPIPVKWAAAELGLIDKGIRLPLTWLSSEYDAAVRAALQQAMATAQPARVKRA